MIFRDDMSPEECAAVVERHFRSQGAWPIEPCPSGCPCDPSASDGLSCPDTSGNLLCDVPDCTIPADGDLCEAHGPAPRTPDAGPYSRSSAAGSAWPWGHPGTLPTDKEILS